MDTLTLAEFSSVGYASGPPLVSPNVLAVVTIAVLVLALISKTVTLASISASYVASSTLTLVSTVLFFVLRVAINHIITLAFVSYTSSALVFAFIKMRKSGIAVSLNNDAFSGMSINEKVVAVIQHLWRNRTQAEAEHEVLIMKGNYQKAANDLAVTNAEITDIEHEVAPMGRTPERTSLETRLIELRAHQSQLQQIKKNYEETYGVITEAYEDATNADVFKEKTSVADFAAMGLNVKSVASARNQLQLKEQYGGPVFNLIMSSLKAPEAASSSSAPPKARAASVVRIKNGGK